MCGIAGVLGTKNPALKVETLLSKIKHRGPDGHGVFSFDENAAIGMCRLRVRSKVEDHVPFTVTEDIRAGYNGEIYGSLNKYAEPSLENPDGGADEVATLLNHPHADGMYAVAISNSKPNKIVIKRDPYGIKPLFYKAHSNSLSFCSELKPLITHEHDTLNLNAVDDLLVFGHMLNHETIYKSVKKLACDQEIHYQHGNFNRVEAQKRDFQCYDPPDIRQLIATSVKKCMLSDRPAGLSLSSGLDSNILAYELNKQKYDNLNTVSILVDGVPDGIEKISQLHLSGPNTWKNWHHHTTQFTAIDLPHYLEQSVLCLGQPTRMTSFPLYMKLAELTHDAGLTVLLSGEGADEIFHGYTNYVNWQPNQYPTTEHAILNFYLDDAHLTLIKDLIGHERLAASINRFKEFIRPHIVEKSPRKTLLKIEQLLRLNALLERADLSLMSRSIEGRVPYLHGGIPEQLMLLPEHNIHPEKSKYLLRQAYQHVMPTMQIPKKRFRIPILHWLENECRSWSMDLIHSTNSGLLEIGIQPNKVENLLNTNSKTAAATLFTLLSYIVWHTKFILRS